MADQAAVETAPPLVDIKGSKLVDTFTEQATEIVRVMFKDPRPGSIDAITVARDYALAQLLEAKLKVGATPQERELYRNEELSWDQAIEELKANNPTFLKLALESKVDALPEEVVSPIHPNRLPLKQVLGNLIQSLPT